MPQAFMTASLRNISSYVPTLRSFINAKRQADSSTMHAVRPSLLLVKMQKTPGMNNLPGVIDEDAIIERHRGSRLRVQSLHECSSEQVLRSIQNHDIVHFACHGISNDLESGLDSSLVFQKHDPATGTVIPDKLYVQQIYDQRLTRPRLAYLSACSTLYLADARLIDESLHLVSSFMVAGFTHVVGTLWMTLDDVCVELTERFYHEYLLQQSNEPGGGGGGGGEVALALQRAMVELRSKRPRQPLAWTPYVHHGL